MRVSVARTGRRRLEVASYDLCITQIRFGACDDPCHAALRIRAESHNSRFGRRDCHTTRPYASQMAARAIRLPHHGRTRLDWRTTSRVTTRGTFELSNLPPQKIAVSPTCPVPSLPHDARAPRERRGGRRVACRAQRANRNSLNLQGVVYECCCMRVRVVCRVAAIYFENKTLLLAQSMRLEWWVRNDRSSAA